MPAPALRAAHAITNGQPFSADPATAHLKPVQDGSADFWRLLRRSLGRVGRRTRVLCRQGLRRTMHPGRAATMLMSVSTRRLESLRDPPGAGAALRRQDGGPTGARKG